MKKTPRADNLYRTLFGKRLALTFSSSAMRRWEHYGRVFNLSLVESKRVGVNENRWMVVASTGSTNIAGRGKTPQGARGALLREIRRLQKGLAVITADL